MKRFGFGLLAAGLLAAATLLTTVPAMADRGGGGFGGGFGNGFGGGMGGMIWLPPRGGMGGWNGAGMRGPGPGWNSGGRNVYRGSNHYDRRWNGNWNGHNWNGQRWNGRNWHGRNWNNWYRNGRWYGPRYRYRYPGYNYSTAASGIRGPGGPITAAAGASRSVTPSPAAAMPRSMCSGA